MAEVFLAEFTPAPGDSSARLPAHQERVLRRYLRAVQKSAGDPRGLERVLRTFVHEVLHAEHEDQVDQDT